MHHAAIAHRLLLVVATSALLAIAACSDDSGGSGATPGGDVQAPDVAPDTRGDVSGTPDTAEPDASPDDADGGEAGGDAEVDGEPAAAGLGVESVVPERGLARGGEQVEILGQGFGDGLQVFFGESLAQDAWALNEDRIVAVTPPRTPGVVDVRVVEPGSGAEAVLDDGFRFYNPVAVDAVDPPDGHVLGGDPVTVTGSGFVAGSHVLIGGRAALEVEILDDGTLLAVTPDAPAAGPADVHVSNTVGVGRLDDGFTYFDSPRVDAVVPPAGPMEGGTPVDVKGRGFAEPMVVTVAGAPLEDVEVLDGGRLTGLVPAADVPGPADVNVATEYGTATARDAYTYLEDTAPGEEVDVLAVTPASGPALGGDAVTVVAKGLTVRQDTTVTFGDAAAVVKGVDSAAHTALVQVPAAEPGTVDVTLTNANGADTLAGGYTYEPYVRVWEVLPNYGPVEGGTPVTVSGEGFEPGLQLRIGALPAADLQVVDEGTVTATTPPGSPGLANVTVLQGGLKDTLVGGFSYQAEMDLWVVEPPHGSQAGGTFVTLAGSGFPSDADVRVGGTPATHVIVESPTRITARTPPGDVGTVDVSVESPTRGTVTLPRSFTYFDPESQFGGTWGEGVDGAVNVTVLSGQDGSPIPDAFVMLWTDPATPYQGYTNLEGQITFSGPDVGGEQMVSASKEGFASSSVVEYDASNITLYLSPSASGSGPPPTPPPAPTFHGQVVNATKYVPVPWGKCGQKTDAPGTLCQPCTEDADCEGLACSDLPDQGSYCTSHCGTDDDCPDGFMCHPVNGQPEHQCIPATGRVTAFCDFTKPTIFSQDAIPQPGQEVLPDFSFEMTVPIGESAVFCWGGIYNEDTDEFTPYVLGLKRHVFAQPGQQLEGDVVLSHPLNGTMDIRLDDPPNNPNGPDFNTALVHLDLGSDGTLEFLHHPVDVEDTLKMKWIPKTLSGNLYDASYTILAGAFSFGADNLPYSVTFHQGIRELRDDVFWEWGTAGWEPDSTGISQNVNDLFALDAETIFGVGTDGLLIRSVGQAWAAQDNPLKDHFEGVHAVSAGDALAVGQNGAVVHWDGLAWTPEETPTTSHLRDVWMADADEAFAVGSYVVLHREDGAWTQMSGNTNKNLRDVWGFAADDVWAVGNYGNVIHWDGASWSTVQTGTTQNFRGVWGPSPDDVFVVGEAGTVLRWDGEALSPMEVDTTETLNAVWGTGPDDVYAVGDRGMLFRWDGAQWMDESPPGETNDFLAVAGGEGRVVVTGTHELLLGPLLEVPEDIQPAAGGTMGEEYEISWTVKPGVDPHFSYVQVAVPGMTGPVPEWTIVNDWDVTSVLLPDFPNIEGTPGIAPGAKILTIIRVYEEGFDIDNYSNQDLNTLRWQSWAQDQHTFTKE
ncbi:MAG: IPT/TIG domain-containing protein [Myxococcota bacterium]